MPETPDIPVVHNHEAHRFEMTVDDQSAFAAYRARDGAIVLTHTEVPRALQRRGIGGALARAALEYAQGAGLAVVPLCPFMARYIRRHPRYKALIGSSR